MLDLNQLIDNAARALIRAEHGDDADLTWGWRFFGLSFAIADRVGCTVRAVELIHQRYALIAPPKASR